MKNIPFLLRRRPQFRTIALGLALFVGTVFLYKFGPDYGSLRTLREAWNLGHIAFFALLVYFASILFNRVRSFIIDATLVVLICFFLGAVIEWSQPFFGRDASWADVYKNVLGGLLALLFLLPSRGMLSKPTLNKLRIGFLVLLGLACLPLGKAIYDDFAMYQQFPILSDLENPYEDDRWSRGDLDHQIVRYGDYSLRVDFSARRTRSTQLKYYPDDWRGYSSLHVSIFNSLVDPFELYFRIYDQTYIDEHRPTDDRFIVKLSLQPGWNDVAFPMAAIRDSPATRTMDLSRIRGVTFYVGREYISEIGPTTVYFDHFYLAR